VQFLNFLAAAFVVGGKAKISPIAIVTTVIFLIVIFLLEQWFF
jgi:hypothetical protein